ncbi:hypothetical protein C8Q73DRAFT_695883 [Cubamyces lactineus]|nr:hypothetical protein C8Q73DRAFT_695883 [Cubamyces lactineus]
MQAYITTTLVGTTRGNLFEDIAFSNAGKIVIRDIKEKPQLDHTHPIKQLSVYQITGLKVVVGLSVVYQLADGKSITISHGYTKSKTGKLVQKDVVLTDNERLVGVFGENSTDDRYKRQVFKHIGFVVVNDYLRTTEIRDPFDSVAATSYDQAAPPAAGTQYFYVSDVVAFGGFETTTSQQSDETDAGIDGLFFYKNVGLQ